MAIYTNCCKIVIVKNENFKGWELILKLLETFLRTFNGSEVCRWRKLGVNAAKINFFLNKNAPLELGRNAHHL